MKKSIYLFSVLILVSIFLLPFAQSVSASAQVEIWDNGTTDWTTTFANGDPIDTGTNNAFRYPESVVDSDGNVYTAYLRLDNDEAATSHIYLSRYNGSDVSVWDNDTTSWTTTFADGDPIDKNTTKSASSPQLAIDSNNNVYIGYSQSDGSNNHIYLSQYDGTSVKIWDNDATAWTTTFANGDPIDTGTTNDASDSQLAIDSTDNVYITYSQSDGSNGHIYLSRYDGTDVEIWDNGATAWTTTLANGDPIDSGTDNQAQGARLAIDSDDNIYIIYLQSYDSNNHIYLSRYDGTDVEIWDNGATAWTTTLANGDPIDNSTYGDVSDFDIAIDSHNDVYLFFSQYDNISETYLSRYTEVGGVSTWATTTSSWSTTLTNAGPINPSDGSGYAYPRIAIDHNDNVYLAYDEDDNGKILLSRYNGEDVRIWDNNTSAWITTFADGDPVDPRIEGGSYYYPEIAIDSTNNVYLTYYDDTTNHIYLSRYDGTSAKIWDNGSAAWTTTFASGDPIDTGTDNQAQEARLAIDSDSNVYITYYQYSGSYSHIYLSRYYTGVAHTFRLSDTSLSLTEGGASETYTLVLNTAPTENVVVTLSTSTPSSGSGVNPSPSVLTFTPANWDTPQTITVTTINDAVISGPRSATISSTVTSEDTLYDGKGISDITISLTEDDVPGPDDPQVQIWDNGASAWTNTFANGDPIDPGTAYNHKEPRVVTDSAGNVYSVYLQNDGTEDNFDRLYLSQYDGTSVKIWDNDMASWTTTFADGDPIDNPDLASVSELEMAIDSLDRVYVVYSQYGQTNNIYINRYDEDTGVSVWSTTTAAWSTTLTDGGPIDPGGDGSYRYPEMAIDHNNNVYLSYNEENYGGVLLSRYNDVSGMKIWDNGASAWTTTLANGDRIDTGESEDYFVDPKVVVDSTGIVYLAYYEDSNNNGVYLSRYTEAGGVSIWSTTTAAWSSVLAGGGPVSTSDYYYYDVSLAADSNGKVYIIYQNSDNNRIYLTRYNGTGVETWDNDTTAWTTVLANGDPIDKDTGDSSQTPELVIDTSDNVYVAYSRSDDASKTHIYLSRFNGTDVRIWDNNTASWTTTFANGGPIDKGTASNATLPKLATDSDDNVYITYQQKVDSSFDRVFLSRYDGTSVKIWDNDTASWTTTFANGDTIDVDTVSYALEKQITVDSNDNAYVVYKQTDDLANYHIYLSRYFTGESEVIVAPTATSSAATSITSTGAVFHGNITATGGESNTIRGFEYGTTNAYGSTASTTGTYDTGEFTATITGLTPFTTYHYMAYSTNSAGTGTSTDLEFTTDSRSSSGSTGHRPSPRPVTPPVNSNPPPFSPTNNFPPVNNPHFTGTLARGSNNAEVLELQRLLSSLGFLTATPNGFFGPQTEAAVRAFQTANNLPPVGIVGPLTRALLNQIPLPGNPSSVSTPRQLVDLLIAIGVIAPDMAERARGAVGE